MQAYTITKYPVFEANQVLSHKHLNKIVSFLEEQDRITRTGLIGIGILCGFEVAVDGIKNEVTIGCGKAVTSLGFEITWERQILSFHQNIELSANFLNADFRDEPDLDAILNKDLTKPYIDIKNTIELSATNTNGELAIPAGFFDNKVIVMLLEVSLINQKNCIAGNCDDKGKRIEFNLRPLAIDLALANSLDTLFAEYPPRTVFQRLLLPRYNMPHKNLVTGSDVLNTFKDLLGPGRGIVTDIVLRVKDIYNHYRTTVSNKFPSLDGIDISLPAAINTNKDTLNVQYLWSWLNDIAAAYNEIADLAEQHPTLCCVNNTLFPYHVVLGNPGIADHLRTPFIKTGNTDEEKQVITKLSFLFERLDKIITSWQVNTGKIKITPSRYGNIPLSQKAIPYYYSNVLALNKAWDPDATLKGRNNEIYAYHSDINGYTNIQRIKDPLSYDIEPYDFFRIEGHIGQDFDTVSRELFLYRNEYNLPFNIVALNAVDTTGKTVDMSIHKGDWADLELDYDMARRKVYNVTEDVINWMTRNQAEIMDKFPFIQATTFTFLNGVLKQIRDLLKDDLNEFLPGYETVYKIFENLHSTFAIHRMCITGLHKESMAPILEDMVDHMDDIDKLFLEDPFTVIYEEAQKRWEVYAKELFLSTYLQQHKGYVPAGGVTAGGTFIIVYSDTSVFKKPATTPVRHALLNTLVEYNASIPLDKKVKDEIASTSAAMFNKKSFAAKLPFDDRPLNTCKDEAENIKRSMKDLAAHNATRFPAPMRTFLAENINWLFQFEPLAPDNSGFPQKVVLADFFIPYTCCGSGTSVYIMPNKPSDPSPPKVGDFLSPDFLATDFKTQIS